MKWQAMGDGSFLGVFALIWNYVNSKLHAALPVIIKIPAGAICVCHQYNIRKWFNYDLIHTPCLYTKFFKTLFGTGLQ